ncbi:tyrosine-type recombinase/integrase [Algiphilus sp.]|uniref:tyrosine-type recombinase/integrase n=1 Tax=Algiphilus sp. TaxID=1872431 RepID=UPI003BA92ADA
MQQLGRKARGSVRELASGHHQARITIQDKPYSRTFTSRVQADSWLARRREDARDPQNLEELLKEEAKTLRAHLEEWVIALEENPTASDSKRICLIKRFITGYPALCGKCLDEITVRHIHRFKQNRLAGITECGEAWKRVAEATVNKELCLISKVFKKVLSMGVSLPLNPVRVAGLFPKAEAGARPRLEVRQEVALMNAAESLQTSRRVLIPFAPLIQFILHTSLRAGDLVAMGWEDVNWARRSILVRSPKNGVARRVSLSPTVLGLLKDLGPVRFGPIWGSYQRINTAWGLARSMAADELEADGFIAQAAELRSMRMHNLRFEAVCRLMENYKLSDRRVAQMSGHKTPIMLWYYARSIDDVPLSEELAAAEGDDWKYDPAAEGTDPVFWEPSMIDFRWRHLRQDKKMLQDAVNRQPITEIAEDMGVSDVAVHRACKRLEVEKPPRGHWIQREHRAGA